MPQDQVAVEEGIVSLPTRDVPIVEVMQAGLGKLGGELIGNGMFRKEVEPDHPLSGSPAFYEFNCTAVELSVDEEGCISGVVFGASDERPVLEGLQVRVERHVEAVPGSIQCGVETVRGGGEARRLGHPRHVDLTQRIDHQTVGPVSCAVAEEGACHDAAQSVVEDGDERVVAAGVRRVVGPGGRRERSRLGAPDQDRLPPSAVESPLGIR